MPNYVGTSPWTDAANSLNGVSQGIGQLALQIPQLRAQQLAIKNQQAMIPYHQRLLDAQTSQAQGRGALASSHAALYQAQAEQAQAGTQGQMVLSQALQKGDLQRAMGAMTFLAKNNPNSLAEAVIKMDSYMHSGLGSQGGAVNPMNAAAATGMPQFAKPTIVPQGGIMVMPGGDIGAQGQNRLGPGQTMIPAVQGAGAPQLGVQSPVAPPVRAGSMSSALDAALLRGVQAGDWTTNDIPKLREVLGQGAGTPTSTPAKGKRVPVTNPKGEQVTIPEEQLPYALKQGYTQ